VTETALLTREWWRDIPIRIEMMSFNEL
jgi:hypothetical protein